MNPTLIIASVFEGSRESTFRNVTSASSYFSPDICAQPSSASLRGSPGESSTAFESAASAPAKSPSERRLHPFSTKVDAPMWSACTAGLPPANGGASDAAASCAFHFATSVTISAFTDARSPSESSASSRRSISAYRSLNPASVMSAIRRGVRHRLFEHDAFPRREQLSGVEDHDHGSVLALRSHDRAQVRLRQPLEERGRGRE